MAAGFRIFPHVAVFLLLSTVVGEGDVSRKVIYRLVYGNVLSVDSNMTRGEYIQLSQFLSPRMKNVTDSCKTSISKQLLYYTTNQVVPATFPRTGSHICYEVLLQLGAHYSLSLTCPSQHTTPHHITVTKDTQNRLHLNQRTHTAQTDLKHFLCNSPYLPSTCLSSLLPFSYRTTKQYNEPLLPPLHSWHTAQCSRHVRCESVSNNDDETVVTIATYNIWNVNEIDGQSATKRTTQLGKLILSSGVDIVGLQEVRIVESHDDQSTSLSQVDILSKVLSGYQFVYQPAMMYISNGKIEHEGLAVFSRYPIISSDYKLLSRNLSDVDDEHQRICLHVMLDTPGGHVHVFVTHLTLSEHGQQSSVREIWQYMSLFPGVGVLMGDLNAEPWSVPVRYLTGEAGIAGDQTHHMVDTWEVAGSGNSLTFSAIEDQPLKRIDYLFLREVFNIHVCIEHIKLLGINRTSVLSDHFGVVARLKIYQPSST